MRLVWGIALGVVAACATPPGAILPYEIVGDAIPQSLGEAGNAERGREIILGRDGNCLLCHVVPGVGKRLMGDIGPSLLSVGSRLNAGQIRLRIVDSMWLNPDTVMPSYYRVRGLKSVAGPWRDRPILSAQQVEDVIAYLQTLRE